MKEPDAVSLSSAGGGVFPALRPPGLAVPLIVLVSMLFVYPMAFLLSASDGLKLFSPASISLLALALALWDFKRLSASLASMSPMQLAPAAVFVAIAFGHFIADGTYKLDDLGFSLIWISLPLCAWMNFRAFEWLFPRFLAFLWVFDLYVSVRQLLYGSEFNGLPGNRNWHAALLLLCTPFFLRWLFLFLRRRFPSIPSPALFGILLVPLSISIYIFQQCHSRGAWLALAAVLFAGASLNSGLKARRAMLWFGVCAAVIVSAAFVFKGVDHAAQIISEDERVILWEGTANLIARHPLWGVGGSSFESEFAPLRPLEYFLNKHSAVRSNHPHNHLFFITACFGVVGLLAWLPLLFWPLISFASKFKEEPNPDMKILYLATLALVLHSMLDLILFEWPTNILTLLALGLFWARAWPPGEGSASVFSAKAPAATVLLAKCAATCFLLLVAVSLFRTASGSWLAWKGTVFARAGRNEIGAYFNRKAVEFCKSDPVCIYRAMTHACVDVKDFNLSLDLFETLDGTPSRNFAHSNGFRGKCLASLGRIRESVPYLILESRNYPLQALPLLNLATAYAKLGRLPEAAAVDASIVRIMEMRGLDMSLLPLIVKKPEYDLRPWEIPAARQPDSGSSP